VRLLRKILYPVSLIYAVVVFIRNYFYDIGLFESKTFKTPTICIGNLSVGGTGKTPMAELLIALLQDTYKVALLSRGYRRQSKGFILADETSTVTILGDEPYQIFSKFKAVVVAVDADRENGIRTLEKRVCPDVIVLDDAYQHRKVTYGFSILLTAYGNLYSDDLYLPTGDLRDNKREAHRATIIVVTKCPPALSQMQQQRIIERLRPEPRQQVLFSRLTYDPYIKSGSNEIRIDDLKQKKLTLVTGIANPKPLVTYLEKIGLTFNHLRFNDHHSFTENEIKNLRKNQPVLTTEKDYVRLKGKVDKLYYVSIKHQFLNDGRKIFEDSLKKFMKLDS